MPGLRSRVMVGRRAELDDLLALATRAQHGRGSFALILGEAGVGKSRLAAELAGTLRQRGHLVITGHGVDLTTGELPYALLADTLRDLAHQIGTDAIHRRLGSRAGDLSALVPALGAGDVWDRARILSASATLIDAIAAESPLYWIIEDLHWADSASRDLAALIAPSLGDRSLMLVATARSHPSEVQRLPPTVLDLAARPEVHAFCLPRLSEPEVREHLKTLGCAALPPPLTDRLVALSDGLPFFVELLAANPVATADDLPPTVRQLMLARLPQLSPATSRLVDAAALAQMPTRRTLLAEVAELPANELDTVLADAVTAGVLEWSRDGQTVDFHHALMREAVAGSMAPPRRRSLHQRWALALEPLTPSVAAATFATAHHWQEAGMPREALAASSRAAALASTMSEAGLEALHLRRTLQLWDEVTDAGEVAGCDRDVLLYDLLGSRWTTGDHKLVQLTCEAELQRREVQADPISRLWMTMHHDRATFLLGGTKDHAGPEKVRRRAAFLLAARPDVRVMDCLSENAALAERYAPELAKVQYERAALLAQQCPSRRARLYTRIFLCLDAVRHGLPQPAIDNLFRLREECAGAPVADMWMIEGNLIHCLGEVGRYQDAIDIGRRAMERLSDPRPVPSLFAFIAGNTSGAHLQLGHWTEADHLLTRASSIRTRPSTSLAGPTLVLNTRRGTIPDPDAAVKAARQRIDSRPDLAGSHELLADLIELLGFLGDVPAMREAVGRLEEVHKEAMPSVVWPGLNAAIRVERSQQRANALPHAFKLNDQATNLRWSSPVGAAYLAEHNAHMARFDGQDDPETWRRAVTAWESVGRIWDQANCHLYLAEALLCHGDRDSAQAHVATAYRFADQLGAAPLGDHINHFIRRARFRFTGATRAPSAIAMSLTVRELEILGLVAEGHNNNDIAASLFISPKTVSVHVSRILSKLNAENRTAAVAIARRLRVID